MTVDTTADDDTRATSLQARSRREASSANATSDEVSAEVAIAETVVGSRTGPGSTTARTVASTTGSSSTTTGSGSRATGTAGSKSIGSAREALEQGAVNRMRMYATAMLGWSALGAPLLLLVPGERIDRIIGLVSLGVIAASFVWLYRRAVTPESLLIEETLPVTIVQALGVSGIAFAAGVISPLNGLVVVGLILYGMSAPPKHSLVIYAIVAVCQAIIGGLALAGVTSGSGLLVVLSQSKITTLLDVVFVELVYATGFFVGRLASGDSARLIADLEEVVRTAAHREALLREARAEMDRAAEIGGPGQFSGQTLGSYRLGDVLGRGGMGEVYEAFQTTDDSPAAVKLLRRDVLGDRDMVRRFEREAKIVANLRSPHIVSVFEVGGVEAPLPYIAMERLRGTELITDLRNRGHLPLREVATMLDEVASGLDVARAAGIVHRDIKPHNLFRADLGTGAGLWKILDFGVSKSLFGEDVSLTANQMLGTPQYMAPEQTKGTQEVDHRADIHALAAIAYRAVSGRLPFAKGELGDVLLAVMHDLPPDPSSFRTLPDDVGSVLRIGLAKRPEERFGKASEFAKAFRQAIDEKLDPAIRERAAKLLAVSPWGASEVPKRPSGQRS